jgi:hypothetical protein
MDRLGLLDFGEVDSAGKTSKNKLPADFLRRKNEALQV